MGKVKLLKYVVFLLAAIAVLYLAYRAVAVVQKGYSWQEMDWDKSGSTSLREALNSSDIGVRPLKQGNQECREYYSYKDGLPVRVDCPAIEN